MISLMKKVVGIARSLPSLAKGDNNGTYNYVRIDDYYEKVAKVALGAGLSWIPSETNIFFSTAPNGDLVQVQSYDFTVFDIESGESSPPIRISVSHPFQDAQTTGSSLSYAEKALMRVLFKVVTGEPDADARAPTNYRQAARPDVNNPFNEKEAANDNKKETAATEDKKPPVKRGKKTDETPPPKEADEIADRNTTANEIAKLDEPPWEGPDQFAEDANLYKKTAAELLEAIAKCGNMADLEQFRLDKADAVAWLKAEGEKNDEAAGFKTQVADAYRAKFQKYNDEDAA